MNKVLLSILLVFGILLSQEKGPWNSKAHQSEVVKVEKMQLPALSYSGPAKEILEINYVARLEALSQGHLSLWSEQGPLKTFDDFPRMASQSHHEIVLEELRYPLH